MSDFLNRISKLSPQRLALLADELNERVQAAERSRRVPLAVVGIGCRLPGGVRDADDFWQLLSKGADAVSEVPPERWDIDEFYHRDLDTPGKMATRWGGFIDAPDQFDPQFFGIAPAEAASMDPQQRLLLETSWEALEHAGIAPSTLTGTAAGVFVGICSGDYSQVALNSPREKITPYFAPGLSHGVAAGRISYVLGLQGPCMAVDTSCSASLVAVHLACQSLRLGESSVALAGGVNLILKPDITIALSQSRMMAPDGRCKAFSETANGFVRGEGCGIIVLKRLPDALRDRNRILAVIRGSACNQDGRSNGLTAPNGPSQEAVISSALADADLRPADVDYIEAHGTGTSLGDPIEIGAINAVFAGRPTGPHPLFVGSVKTNLGHLEPAAGIAGLIKLVLSIHHGKIPASLHFEKPNRRIEWERLPIHVPTELHDWNRRGEKRVGGVSSFGFSGTNAHVVVEEHAVENRGDQPSELKDTDRPLLFLFSAKTESALKTMAVRAHGYLLRHRSISMADVAHTLNAGRSRFEHRAAITATSHAKLTDALGNFESHSADGSIQTGRARTHSPRVAFVFAQSEFPRGDFARELFDQAPAFREAIERCEQVLSSRFEKSLISVLFPDSGDRHDRTARENAAATFALQYALAELWRGCGIEPHAVLGQGTGEYVAACIAGIFSLEDGLLLAIASAVADPAERAKCAHPVMFQASRTVFIPNRMDPVPQVNAPEYWLSTSGTFTRRALLTLAEENCAATLILGDNTAFQEFVKYGGTPKPGKSPSNVFGDCREFLETAAALYVLGCDFDADGLYRDQTTTTVSLPTYPFERERYWLDERPMPVGRSQEDPTSQPDTTSGADDWIYDLVWDPKPLRQEEEVFAANFIDMLPARSADAELIHYSNMNAQFDPICATYIADALKNLGADFLPDLEFTLGELSQRLNIVQPRLRLFERLLTILAEDGMIERVGDAFRLSRLLDARKLQPAAATGMQNLQAAYPLCRTEMNVVARCGGNLAAVLAGETDPIQLLFPNNSTEETEHIYGNSPMACYYNELIADLVQAAVENAGGRKVRILEIGAGTGATTRSILQRLADSDFDYTFTDISPAFLTRARGKFADFPSLQYRVLNIENDPASQGFERAGFDVVIAANVLHATLDLRDTIAHVRELLAPGGLSLLLEGMRPDRAVDLTFGLTEGWWRFVDKDVRPYYPLISADRWTRLLTQSGMVSTRVMTCATEDAPQPHQMVIVAQAPAAQRVRPRLSSRPARSYLILADESGIGAAVHAQLTAAGEPCQIIRRSQSGDTASRICEFLSHSGAAPTEIVYLWGTDVSDSAASLDLLSEAVDLCVKTPVHIIQAMLQRVGTEARLWLVTRGAQATSGFSPTVGAATQSMMWGVGRVLGLENPELYRGLIDLEPSQSTQKSAATLIAELWAEDIEDQIAYRDGQRLAVRLKHSRIEAPPANAPQRLRKDGAYLVTGGLGGIGLRFSRWAASQGAGHLVLLGRTGTGANAGPFAVERLQAIREIEELGARVTVVEGDVTSERDMELLFRRFGEELPPLLGIVHAVTSHNNQQLAGLSDEQTEAMLAPKVRGAWILHTLTQALNLDFFLAFSSAASVLGGRGMAHYAAANLFLDTFAHSRRALGLPMLAINWGAWEVMRRFTREDRDRFTQTGLLPMDADTLFHLIGELIHSPRAQVMIASVDWNLMKPILESNRVRPMLQNLGSRRSKEQNPGNHAHSAPSSLRAVEAMMPEDRKKFIEDFVLERTARVLGFRRGELPPADIPLTDLGLDSLMAVDLKNHLQSGLGRDLPPTIVFDFPTVSAMVGMLETMLWAARSGAEDDIASVQKDEICI